MEERRVRLRWVGNKSKDDGKVEDVPVHCLLEEDRRTSLRAGCTVRVHGARARVWRGVILEIVEPPTALDLTLPATRSCKQVVC